MIPVRTAAGSRAADAAVIDGLGLPGFALMEVASKGLAEVVRAQPEAGGRVVVVCGPGHNGGDGYGCARWLRRWGIDVAVWPQSALSAGDAGLAREAARRVGVPEVDGVDGATLIVDALFGTGLSRAIDGRLAAVVAAMEASAAPVVAADLPSGLDADTGAVLGVSLHARATVTFGAAKRGLYAGEGPARAGAVTVVDLGLDPADRDAEVPEAHDLAGRWPVRAPDAHKTRSGHLLVIAGSEAMAGAAHLVCAGALAAGVGLVTLLVQEGASARLGGLPPEVMLLPGGLTASWTGQAPVVDRFDAVAAGPGLGGGHPLPDGARAYLGEVCRSFQGPMVLDADALIAAETGPHDRVVTPHPGEAARWLSTSVAALQADRFAAVRRLSDLGFVALLKGPHTLVSAGAHPISINPTGHPVLATGGSGDVLTGVIGALLARGLSGRDAAILGAYVHGLAGQRLAAVRREGWTASDIAAAVPDAVAQLTSEAGLP